jgi:hypothetical protein
VNNCLVKKGFLATESIKDTKTMPITNQVTAKEIVAKPDTIIFAACNIDL